MEIIQENLAPQIAVEIDRRCNPVACGERETCMTIWQRFEVIITIRELQVRAIHIDMGFDGRGDGIGAKPKIPASSRFSSQRVTIS